MDHPQLYSKRIPASKRRRRGPKSSRTTSPSSTSSSEESSSESESLGPPPVCLPATPLTPSELIHSNTLARVLKPHNQVFSQIALSATGLIENDLPFFNKLQALIDLLRGHLHNHHAFSLVNRQLQQLDQQQPPLEDADCADGAAPASREPRAASQYRLVTETQPLIAGMFGGAGAASYASCVQQLTKFVGDLEDYQARLAEIRDGCLGIEKRRKAVWRLARLAAAEFDAAIAPAPPSPAPRAFNTALPPPEPRPIPVPATHHPVAPLKSKRKIP